MADMGKEWVNMKDMNRDDQGFTIKQAEPKDAPLALEFIRKLGVYQKMRDKVVATEQDLRALLTSGAGEAIFGVLEGEGEEEEVVAFLYYYPIAPGILGKKGIYIDVFYVEERYRSMGLGKKMMRYMVQLACMRDCERLEWVCLNWNESAIDFYKKLGGDAMDMMTTYRLAADKIQELADSEA